LKIAIVGGGSAGWMTAAFLIKTFPDYDISVIESPDIPRIGVGESTYDGFKYFIKYLDIDLKDFFVKTDATIKTAIQFNGFYDGSENDEFLYPFGSPDISGTLWGLQDWQIKKSLYPDTPIKEYAESHFFSANLIKHNTFTEENIGGFDHELHTALHFDALKFADWLKNDYAIPRGVKLISKNVKKIVVKDKNVQRIILDDKSVIFAELYVDCTGFKSLLLGKALKEKFISISDELPNDSAWATQIQYKDKEKEMLSVTKSTAIENGWCWYIPLWSRIGAGYVYSSKYVSDNNALKEFKQYIKKEHDLNDEEIKNLKFNKIKMKTGIYENVWKNNVVGIGLSAAFIEPLQSNGLFTVHQFLYELGRALLRGGMPSQFEKDVFNFATKNKYFSFLEFIKMNYYLSKRQDTNYWKEIKNKKIDFSKIDLRYFEANHFVNLLKEKTFSFSPPMGGCGSWVTSGMNYFILDNISTKLGEIENKMNYREQLDESFSFLDEKRNYWDFVAKNSMSIKKYLENKYYNN
jgi:flavin-dependent dehydrogenase